MGKKEQNIIQNLLNALGDMIDHFEGNEQYSEDDSAVIKFARHIYDQASSDCDRCHAAHGGE